MGPCQELFGGVYGNIDIFFNMAECLGLARGSDASPSNTTATSPSASASSVFTGAAPVNTVQRGLWIGMIAFQMAIGWFVLGL